MGAVPAQDEGGSRLWNDGVEDSLYGGRRGSYQYAVLEQYRLYVEMSDRVSQRRGLANTFFLTLNTAVLTAVGVFWEPPRDVETWWLAFPAVGLVGQCVAWYAVLRSYRQLNTAKYAVIGELEQRLPASPYHRAEWSALGEGRDRRRYRPLTSVERWVPVLFAFLYVGGLAAALAAQAAG